MLSASLNKNTSFLHLHAAPQLSSGVSVRSQIDHMSNLVNQLDGFWVGGGEGSYGGGICLLLLSLFFLGFSVFGFRFFLLNLFSTLM